MKSALALQNLKEYINYGMKISNWESYSFDKIKFIYNGHRESLFNYAFCEDDVTQESVIEVLNFLKGKGWEATWPVDTHMKRLSSILDKLKLLHTSSPKKAVLNVSNFIELASAKKVDGLKLVKVNSREMLDLYDQATSEIFYHDEKIVTQFLRGLQDDKEDKLQVFLGQIGEEYVGTCAIYFGSVSAGFYADGVFRRFRSRGIASQMVSQKIKIVQNYGYKYAIAHCMSASVRLYERLGFRMLGNLKLYISE